MPTVAPPITAPTDPLPVPLPLEPFRSQETSGEAHEQGQVQPQPPVVDLLPPKVEGQMNQDLPPATIDEPMDDGTEATMRRSNRTRRPS